MRIQPRGGVLPVRCVACPLSHCVGMRVVVVGVGSIGRRHAQCLLERGDDGLIVELCESNGEQLAMAFDPTTTSSLYRWRDELRVWDDFSQMLADPPDAALICTPPVAHCRQTVACLGRGIHVLCEKPMSKTIYEGEEMRRAAAQSGAVLAIGYTMHFSPALRRIRGIVSSGELGQIAHCHWDVGTLRTLINSKSNWQADTDYALLLDYGHQPDSLFWLLGEAPRSVYAVGANARPIPCPEVPGRMITARPMAVSLTLGFESELVATINLNYVQSPDQSSLTIVGDRGWLQWDGIAGTITRGALAPAGGGEELPATVEDAVPQGHASPNRNQMYVDEHSMFFDCIAGRATPGEFGLSADDAIVAQYVIGEAAASIESEGVVHLPGSLGSTARL